MIPHSSLDRLDRMPFVLQRWNGSLSLSFFLHENEVSKLDETLSPFLYDRITYTFYIVKTVTNEADSPYYVKNMKRGTFIMFNQPIFPLNTLRDLAIESIDTTHYLLIDIDFFTSSTLYSNLYSYKSILEQANSVVLLPTFTTEQKKLTRCRRNNTCKALYDS